MRVQKKHELATRRHWRVRKKVIGTTERPRMSVKFSGQHIYVQFVDDSRGHTLAAVSTRQKGVPSGKRSTANVANATALGRKAAEAAKAVKIEAIVFDRGSSPFHGKVKALADAAREGGLKF